MKKVFNLIILLLSSLISIAQSNTTEFAPNGAEWWHGNMGLDRRISENDLPEWFTVVSKHSESQVIEDQEIKKIDVIEYFKKSLYGGSVDSVALDPLYVYSTEDTVFIYNTYFDKFTPLYVFNVEEGDTICLPVIPHPFYTPHFLNWYHPIAEQDSFFCVKVDSVRMVLYDEEYLETVFTSEIADFNQNELVYPTYNYSQGIFSEEYVSGQKVGYARKIGSLSSYMLPAPSELLLVVGGQLDTITENFYPLGFRCYREENMSINIYPEQGCDFIRTINIEEPTSNSSVLIYPNPASHQIYFKLPQDVLHAQVALFDVVGRVIIPTTLKGPYDSLDVSTIPAGLYLLKIKIGEQETYQKLMIR